MLPQRTEGAGGRRFFAALAYVLPFLGGCIGLALDGQNSLTRNHAQQSIGAVLALALSFLVWAVLGYAVALVPSVGPIVAISLFSLVIAMGLFLLANWLIGLLWALRGQEVRIPFANRIADRLFGAE